MSQNQFYCLKRKCQISTVLLHGCNKQYDRFLVLTVHTDPRNGTASFYINRQLLILNIKTIHIVLSICNHILTTYGNL